MHTDNQAIAWARKQTKNALMARWNMELCEYSFEIKHRPGKSNSHCDALSRRPLQSEAPYGEAKEEQLLTVDVITERMELVAVAKRKRKRKVNGHGFQIEQYTNADGIQCVEGTEVKNSLIPNAGKGLFTTRTWNANEIIALYEGHITKDEPWAKEAHHVYC